MIACSLISLQLIVLAETRAFFWLPNNNFRTVSNWKDKRFPCGDDRILMTSMNGLSAMIDSNLAAPKIVFPDNGVVFLDEHIKIQEGIGSTMNDEPECESRQEDGPGDVYFEETDFISVYNPSAWHHTEAKGLHMNLVPSQRDDVLIGDELAVQLSIEDTWNLRSLRMNNRTFTPLAFKNFASTIEGEFQVKLGHLLAKEKDKAGMQMQQPTQQILNLVEDNADGLGVRSWNSNKNIMYMICQYIQEESTSGVCVNPVKPFGHCFPICGATINFASRGVQLNAIQEVINTIQDQPMNKQKVQITLERINDDDLAQEYQITLIPRDNGGYFDERFYITLANLIRNKITESAFSSTAFFGFRIEHSRTDYSFSLASKVIGSSLFFGALLVILVVYHYRQGTFTRMSSQPLIPILPVLFHRKDDIEVVELMDSGKGEHLDPELDNPNFDEPLEKASPLSIRRLSQGPSQIETQNMQRDHGNDIPMTLLDL